MSKPRSPLRSPTLKEILAGAERAAKRMESWPKWMRDLSRNPSQRQPLSSPEPKPESKPKEKHHMETIRITIDVTYSGDSPDPSTLLDSVQDNCAELLDPYDDTPVDSFNVSVEEK